VCTVLYLNLTLLLITVVSWSKPFYPCSSCLAYLCYYSVRHNCSSNARCTAHRKGISRLTVKLSTWGIPVWRGCINRNCTLYTTVGWVMPVRLLLQSSTTSTHHVQYLPVWCVWTVSKPVSGGFLSDLTDRLVLPFYLSQQTKCPS